MATDKSAGHEWLETNMGWLIILVVLTMADYLSRPGTPTAPWTG